jgi:BirA family biotin operon repressor/biotin-[acetyl-CoA-carboxylase] ligase
MSLISGWRAVPPGSAARLEGAAWVDRHLQIVRLLADGELWSGEDIAARLCISRAAVWKAVRKASEILQLEIDAVRGRGYRLRAPLELLDTDVICAALMEPVLGQLAEISLFDLIDSTNTWLMQQARAGAPSGSLCLAERQSAGRGRRGRTWVSPFGGNIYLSLLWRFGLSPAELSGLSLAAGVAVARALESAGAADVGLKWPNDLHWRRRKLAGLLLEVAGESQGPSWVVIGVGVNLRLNPVHAADIDQPWVDLATVLGGSAFSRNAVAAALIAELTAMLSVYGEQGFVPLVAEWRSRDAYLGEPVTLVIGEQRIAGVHAGIDGQGALLLEIDGELRAFQAGEVSLRTYSQ